MYKKKNFSRNNRKKSKYDLWFVREISELVNIETSLIKQKMSLDIYLKQKVRIF